MRVAAVDVDLLEQGKSDVVIGRAERLDLARRSRLLRTELVAGKAEHREAARTEIAMQILQPAILRREAAFARGVDDQQHLSGEAAHGHFFAEKRVGLEIVDHRHRYPGGSMGDGGTPPASIASPASRQRSSR